MQRGRARFTAVGEKIFELPREVLASSAALAANLGLYNGFLAAGLVWGLAAARRDIKIFFLGCVIVAGIFGAATASLSILFSQALPAAVALALMVTLWLGCPPGRRPLRGFCGGRTVPGPSLEGGFELLVEFCSKRERSCACDARQSALAKLNASRSCSPVGEKRTLQSNVESFRGLKAT